MARAEQVVGLLLPKADRAANVRADLGVAQDSTDVPVATRRGIWILFGSIRTTTIAAFAFWVRNSVPSRSFKFSGSPLIS